MFKNNMIFDEVLPVFHNCKLRKRYKMDSVIKLNRKISTHIPKAATLTTDTVNVQGKVANGHRDW